MAEESRGGKDSGRLVMMPSWTRTPSGEVRERVGEGGEGPILLPKRAVEVSEEAVVMTGVGVRDGAGGPGRTAVVLPRSPRQLR